MPVSKEKAALREEAAAWFARMQGPDAQASRFAFEAWRRADPAHDAAYRSIEQSWDQASLLALTSVGRSRSLSRARRPFYRASAWQIALAVAAAVIIAAGFSAFLYRELAPLMRQSPPPGAEIATRVGGLRTVRLPDGSTVTLDTDSAISKDVAGSRTVRLIRGRARFDIAHDPSHPFAVETGQGEVVAHGTLFDVDLTHPDLRVTLYRGSVDVKLAPGEGTSAAVVRRLVPGQRFQAASVGFEPVVDAAPSGEDQWVSGMLSFDTVPLGEVASEANRYSSEHIHIAPNASALKVTGAFQSGHSEELARSLATTFNLSLRHRPDGDWELGS